MDKELQKLNAQKWYNLIMLSMDEKVWKLDEAIEKVLHDMVIESQAIENTQGLIDKELLLD